MHDLFLELGSNSLLELNGKSVCLIDDVKLASFGNDKDFYHIDLILEKTHKLRIIFADVTNFIFELTETFETYSTHDNCTEIESIDQIIFDPKHTESNFRYRIIGLGWVLLIKAATAKWEIL